MPHTRHTQGKALTIWLILAITIATLFALCLLIGPVSIAPQEVMAILLGGDCGKPSWQYIVMESRLPQAITAVLCGGALASSGLMLQTAFRNPLAGPDVFGISSGASLGVALMLLLWGGSVSTALFSLSGFVAILGAAFAGAMCVTALIFLFSTLMRNGVMLLIVGIMVGYVASSAVSLLNFFATEEGVRGYMIWGMGNFGGVSMRLMPAFATITLAATLGSVLLAKPLNIIQMGAQYAESLGVDTRRLRNILLILVGIITATTTAFCGPIAFIGLAVPHMARLLLGSDDQRQLLPTTILCGSAVALLCNLLCALPGEHGTLPLNAITPLIGAPVIIYIIAKKR